jgi:hypothetical protein
MLLRLMKQPFLSIKQEAKNNLEFYNEFKGEKGEGSSGDSPKIDPPTGG